MKKMMIKITPKHMSDNKILLKLEKYEILLKSTLIVPNLSQSPLWTVLYFMLKAVQCR